MYDSVPGVTCAVATSRLRDLGAHPRGPLCPSLGWRPAFCSRSVATVRLSEANLSHVFGGCQAPFAENRDLGHGL